MVISISAMPNPSVLISVWLKIFNGLCNLRFDDTNPTKKNRNILIRSWRMSDGWALTGKTGFTLLRIILKNSMSLLLILIKKGKAYVDSLSADEIREYRGTLTDPGKESPYRNRSVEENLDLFERMKTGEFPDGTHVLRAKIDMASGNLNMRDPVMYRILHASHHRTGDKWCIYPMYDFAHGQSDSIEGITHSICTLEFEDHRPLYDWFIDELELDCHPQQIEFARLNLTYTMMSKRKLVRLVTEGYVKGWDDPRMPTISGLRRRGYTPESIRDFCDRIGVAKKESMVDIALLEHCLREDLNKRAPRVMAVLKPLKVVIENYPEEQVEELDAVNNPEDPDGRQQKSAIFQGALILSRMISWKSRQRSFSALHQAVRYDCAMGILLPVSDVKKDDATGEIRELSCTYDPETRGGKCP